MPSNLQDIVFEAFCKAPRPATDEISNCRCDECQELAKYFSSFDPSKVTIDDLRCHETLLVHGSAKAFRYFLQFFIAFALVDLEKAGAIPDLILWVFSMDHDHLDRTYLLSLDEIESVKSFFETLASLDEIDEQDLTTAQKTINKLKSRK